MENTEKTEFSLQGLIGLLAQHGFRVVSGDEGEKVVMRGRHRPNYTVQSISLTVTKEEELPTPQ